MSAAAHDPAVDALPLRAFAHAIGATSFEAVVSPRFADKPHLRAIVFRRRPHDLHAVVKFCSAAEVRKTTAVAERLPFLLPTIHAAHADVETPGNQPSSWLLLEDLAVAGYGAFDAQARPHFPVRDVLRALASVHAAFADRTEDLERRGLHPQQIPPPAEVAATIHVVQLLARVLFPDANPSLLEQLELVGPAYPAIAQVLTEGVEGERRTLVHGDFHQKNVLFDPAGRLRIVDWAAAHIGWPQSDLVFYDREHLDIYLSGMAAPLSFPRELFYRRHAAVTVTRMITFLGSCARLVLLEPESATAASILPHAPLYLETLVHASAQFRP